MKTASKREFLRCLFIAIWLVIQCSGCKPGDDSIESADVYVDTTSPIVAGTTPTSGSSAKRGTSITIDFSEAMDGATVTTNTTDMNCSGSIQVSADDFGTCVQMSSAPVSNPEGNSFVVAPASKLSLSETYNIKIADSVQDIAGNSLLKDFRNNTGFSIDRVTQISAGRRGTCAVLDKGTTECWGWGMITTRDPGTIQSTPVAIDNLFDVAKVSIGGAYACALLGDQTIKCWGHAWEGQLGDGSTADFSRIPVVVSNISSAKQMSTGFNHACALLNDQTVQCWGGGNSGALGNGGTTDQFSPVAVSNISSASQVLAGNGRTCAILINGTVQCWGSLSYFYFDWGQLITEGEEGEWEERQPPQLIPVPVNHIFNATQLSDGYVHTCALLSDKTVQCWGSGVYGQLGNDSTADQSSPVAVNTISDATQISVGGYTSCALLSTGTIKCWGSGEYGQLGNGSSDNQSIPVTVSGITNAIQMSVGVQHACALLSNYDVKCWGSGVDGQLGNGSTESQSIPVTVSGL